MISQTERMNQMTIPQTMRSQTPQELRKSPKAEAPLQRCRMVLGLPSVRFQVLSEFPHPEAPLLRFQVLSELPHLEPQVLNQA